MKHLLRNPPHLLGWGMVLIALGTSTVIWFRLSQEGPWYASPTAERPWGSHGRTGVEKVGTRSYSIGHGGRDHSEWPASDPLPDMKSTVRGDRFVIAIEPRKLGASPTFLGSTGFGPGPIAIPFRVGQPLDLGDGASIEVFGVATSVPDLETGEFPPKPTLYAADGNAVIDASEWGGLKLPKSLQDWKPITRNGQLKRPQLHLLLRISGQPASFVQLMDSSVSSPIYFYDERTQQPISNTYGGGNWEAENGWLHFWANIGIWHDAPFEGHFTMATGSPLIQQLPVETGAQIMLGTDVRVQNAGIVPGEIVDYRPHRLENELSYKHRQGEGVSLALILNGKEYARRLAVRVNERIYYPKGNGWADSPAIFYLNDVENTVSVGSIDVIALPDWTALNVHVPSIPGMPNGPDIRNLFEAKVYFEGRNTSLAYELALEAVEGNLAERLPVNQKLDLQPGVYTPRELIEIYNESTRSQCTWSHKYFEIGEFKPRTLEDVIHEWWDENFAKKSP